MPEPSTKYQALMFIDIPGAEAIRERENTEHAQVFLRRCMGALTGPRDEHGGRLIRTVSSTLFCAFDDVGESIAAACEMQEAVRSLDQVAGTEPALRIAIHAGEVFVKAGSCAGEAITKAARIISLTRPMQIVVTHEVKRASSAANQENMPRLKGMDALERRLGLKLFTVRWRRNLETISTDPQKLEMIAGPRTLHTASSADSTVPVAKVRGKKRPQKASTHTENLSKITHKAGAPKKTAPPRKIRLTDRHRKTVRTAIDVSKIVESASQSTAQKEEKELRRKHLCVICHDQVLVVDSENDILSIGRDEESDIIVTVDTASREHAQIRCKSDRFFLKDHSTNGTFLYDETGTELWLEDDEHELGVKGAICPGCPQDEEECEVLLYWVTE